jgi:hypothetical protein
MSENEKYQEAVKKVLASTTTADPPKPKEEFNPKVAIKISLAFGLIVMAGGGWWMLLGLALAVPAFLYL